MAYQTDSKNIGMTGIPEAEYRQFLAELEALNNEYKNAFDQETQEQLLTFRDTASTGRRGSGQLDLGPSQDSKDAYTEDFFGLVNDYGINPVVEGTDKVYYLDPGMPGINPYGPDAQFNDTPGTRPGMYTRDRRTEGDFDFGNALTGIVRAATDPLNYIGLGGEGGGGVPWLAIARGGIEGGMDDNYGVNTQNILSYLAEQGVGSLDDPDTAPGETPATPTLEELLEMLGAGVIPDDFDPGNLPPELDWPVDTPPLLPEQPEETQDEVSGGGGGGGGAQDPAEPTAPTGGGTTGDIDPDRPWRYEGNGVLTNVLTGETVTVGPDEASVLVQGDYYGRGTDPGASDQPDYGAVLTHGMADDGGQIRVGSYVNGELVLGSDSDGLVTEPSTSPTGTDGTGTGGTGTDGTGTDGIGDGDIGDGTGNNGTGDGNDGDGQGDGGEGDGQGGLNDMFSGSILPYNTVQTVTPPLADVGPRYQFRQGIFGNQQPNKNDLDSLLRMLENGNGNKDDIMRILGEM